MAISVLGRGCLVATASLVSVGMANAQTGFSPTLGPLAPMAQPAPAVAQAAPPEAAPAEPATALPAKPKPAAKPVVTVALTNASDSTALEVVVTAGDMVAKLDKPLASKAKAALRLPKLKGCTVAVAAMFESGAQVDIPDINICKDRAIRFTD